MKLYLLLIAMTALIVAGAAGLSNLDLTRIETGPSETFTLAPTLPAGTSSDKVTVKMSVAPCRNQPHLGGHYRIERWQSGVSASDFVYLVSLRRIILISSNPKT